MTAYADLEIGLHRRNADSYAVELRFSQPDSDADIRSMRDLSLVQFDIESLQGSVSSAEAYGQLLGKSLFADPELQNLFNLWGSDSPKLASLA